MAVKVTKEACRGARALLNLSTQAAAAELGISPVTLNAIENGAAFRAGTEAKIIEGFARLGVEILNGDRPGARMKAKAEAREEVGTRP